MENNIHENSNNKLKKRRKIYRKPDSPLKNVYNLMRILSPGNLRSSCDNVVTSNDYDKIINTEKNNELNNTLRSSYSAFKINTKYEFELNNNNHYNNIPEYIQQISKREEAHRRESNLIKLPSSIVRASKSICKIETPFKEASGFLIKLSKGEENFFCLMTNEHVITRELIEQQQEITFYYDGKSECNTISLNRNKRFIKHFREEGIDATIVEILPEDNISKDYFLLPNMDYMFNYNNYLNRAITIVQYTNGNLCYANGKIVGINGNEFTHLAETKLGSSGSPIFLKNTITVIGIHKSGDIFSEEKYGDFIIPIFNYMKKMNKIKNRQIKNLYNDLNKFNKRKQNKFNHNLDDFLKRGDKQEKKLVLLNPKIINIFINKKEKDEKNKNNFYYNDNNNIGQRKDGKKNAKGLNSKKGEIIYAGYDDRMEENDGEEVPVKARGKKGKKKFLIGTPINDSRPRCYIQPVKPRTSYRIQRVVSLTIYNNQLISHLNI